MANRFLSNIQVNDAYTFPSTDGAAGQAIVTDGSGNLSFEDITSASVIYQDNFVGDGTTTDFTFAQLVNEEIKTFVFLSGVYQFKDTYSVTGATLAFNTAPANGTLIEVITIEDIGTASLSTGIVTANIFINPKTITEDIVIQANSNAMILGPVSINSNITVGTNSDLKIL